MNIGTICEQKDRGKNKVKKINEDDNFFFV